MYPDRTYYADACLFWFTVGNLISGTAHWLLPDGGAKGRIAIGPPG